MPRRLLPFCAIVLAVAFTVLLSRPGSSVSAPISEADHSPQRSTSSVTTITTDTIVIPTYPYAAYLYTATNTTYNIPYRWLHWAQYQGSNPQPTNKTYTRLTLENEWLRVSLLPELGGRVYEMIFKPTGNNELYRNTVIKPTNWGPPEQGWWLAAGGIEWGLPVEEHGYESAIPWSYTIITGTAGITVTLRDSLQPDRLRAAISVFLPNDRAVLIVRPRIENERSVPLDFKWWINAMLAPGPGNSIGKQGSNPDGIDLKFVFPESQVTVHSTGDPTLPQAGQVMAWPIYKNRDMSRLQNWKQWLGFFARPFASQDWVSVIDQAHQEGVVRVFPRNIARGSKGFAMGWQSPIGAGQWTNDDSYYAELHGGLAPTFWDSVSIGAHQAIEWEETWYPIAGLDNVVTATDEAALSVQQTGNLLNIGVYAASALNHVRIGMWQRSTCQQMADLFMPAIDPASPQNFSVSTSVPLDDLAILFHDLSHVYAGYNEADCIAPIAGIADLPAVSTSSNFTVTWSGFDLYSGVASYDVHYKNGYHGAWTPWLTATTTTTAQFTGSHGHTYFFRARARDTQGNVGAFDDNPFNAEFTTVLLTPAPAMDLSYKAAPKFVSAGSSINYQIAVKNTGNLTGSIALTDILPASLTLISGTLTAWSGTPVFDGSHILWSGDIPPELGTLIQYALTSTVPASPGTIFTNTVVIEGGVVPVTRTATTTFVIDVYLPLLLR
jgi:uncharacterized repeat protein (TIGR01451 family)